PDLAASFGPPQPAGLPTARLAFGRVLASLVGSPAGRRAVATVSRAACGLRAGLPLLPSPATPYRCLPSVAVQSAVAVQTALGARVVTLGHGTPGHPVNVDAPHMQTSSRDRKSTRLNSSHEWISYAVFCL